MDIEVKVGGIQVELTLSREFWFCFTSPNRIISVEHSKFDADVSDRDLRYYVWGRWTVTYWPKKIRRPIYEREQEWRALTLARAGVAE